MTRLAIIIGSIALVTVLVAWKSFDPGPPPLAEEVKGKPTFTFAIPNDPGNLDPGRTSASTDFRVVKCLYEPLLVVKWGGGENKVAGDNIEAGTAEAMPVISEDKLTYTFTIRADAKWSDGHPVTAHDFYYSWRRSILPDTAGDYTSLFFVIEGAEDFFNWRAALIDFGSVEEAFEEADKRAEFLARYPDLESQSKTLSDKEKWALTERAFEERVGLKVIDDRTLQVRLKSPTAYFLDLAAFPTYSPLPRHVFQRWDTPEDQIDPDRPREQVDEAGWYIPDDYFGDPERLVTNGAYYLREWRRKVRMVFDQNPYYWNKDAMGNVRIIQLTIPDTNLQILQFEEGNIDWIPDVGEIKEKLVQVDYPHAHKFNLAGTYYYHFNCRDTLPNGVKNPMTDARVRRAMGMCIDRKTIVQNVTQMNEPTAGLVVPDAEVPGYTGPHDAALKFDPEGAKKLLAEAGYPGGKGFPPIQILVNNDGGGQGHANIALAIKKNWEDFLGLNVTIEAIEFKVLLERSKKGDFFTRRAGWYGDYADPTTWLDMHRQNDSNNDAKYYNPAYDKLLDQAAVELDPDKRFELLAQAEAMLMQDAPLVPIFYYLNVTVYDADKVIGLKPNAWNNFRLELVTVKRDNE